MDHRKWLIVLKYRQMIRKLDRKRLQRLRFVIILVFAVVILSKVQNVIGGTPMAEEKEQKLVTPTPQQVAWQDMEIGMFIHFGPETWQDVEEDNLSTPMEQINPSKLDTDQWVHAAEVMGAKYIVFVTKGSGGFCNWQTNTTDYSIKSTPWRGGKGDMVRDPGGVMPQARDQTWGVS